MCSAIKSALFWEVLDVNECKESLDSCERGSEVCRNTAGAYECDSKCELGYRYDTRARTCQGKSQIFFRFKRNDQFK